VKHCVNPDHLEAVAHATNIRRGALAKLAVEQVREIRRLAAAKDLTYREIAHQFNCSTTNVSAIVQRKSWKDV
jgi:DNA-directed RNA polymerase specialized sigma24 family protein